MKTIMGAALEFTIAGLLFGPVGITILACVYVVLGAMYIAQEIVAIHNERNDQ